MKIKTLVFNGLRLTLVQKNVLEVKKDHVLAKTLYFYIGPVDNMILSGRIISRTPIVIGTSGVVRILETPTTEENISGKIAIISPVGSGGLLGVNINGLASTYTDIHVSHIFEIIEAPKPIHAIYPYVALGLLMADKAGYNVLIAGCSLSSVVAALAVKDRGGEPVIICNDSQRVPKRFGLKTAKNLGELNPSYDSMIIDITASFGLVDILLENISFNRIIVPCLTLFNHIRLPRKSIHIEYIDKIKTSLDRIDKYAYKIKKLIHIIRSKELEDIIGLLPVRNLGLIVEINK